MGAPESYRDLGGDAVCRTLSNLFTFAVLATTVLTASARADEAKGKHVWVPPIEVTQALNITMETKATETLLQKADEQCFDAECHKQVGECRKVLATCVIVPSKASVHEQEMENN
jgi:hypothetical protein